MMIPFLPTLLLVVLVMTMLCGNTCVNAVSINERNNGARKNGESGTISCQDITDYLPFAVTPTSDASNESLYDQSRKQYASNMASSEISDKVLSPDVIAFCSTDNEVLQAIEFGKACGYKITIRSGGHQYAGFSSCAADVDGPVCMQIDTSALESSHYDEVNNELTLGPGLDIEQVHSILVPLGITVPMGICKSVNVGGHFQSSAAGFLARSMGLGLDHVVSFRIALANGTIVTAKRGDELYWAALGGSPGSWVSAHLFYVDASILHITFHLLLLLTNQTILGCCT